MVHLLNSAVMPQAGSYRLYEITADEFRMLVHEAKTTGKLKHYIAYQSTLAFVQHLIGLDMGETNGDKTIFEDGDRFYVIRLKYRVAPWEKKNDNPNVEDFEFFRGYYAAD